ncbi:MAG: CvpA family protein [Clostridia bacterium]|nr:CvpA family protein [Clostridia bacterium]
MDSINSIITIGFLAAVGVLFLFGFLRGLRKGFYKSLMDIGFVVLSVIVSIIISKALTNKLADVEFLKETLITLKDKVPDMASTVDSILEYINQLSGDPAMINVLLALPAALLTPIVFIPVYILFGILIKIPKLIIERIVVGKNGGPEYRGGSRLLGGLVGGIRNALFIVVLLIPIFGYVGMVGDIAVTIDSVSLDGSASGVSSDIGGGKGEVGLLSSGSGSSVEDEDDSIISPEFGAIINHPVIKGVNACGGRLIFNSLATKNVEGVKVSGAEEVTTFAKVYANMAPLINEDPENYGEEQKQGIENIETMLSESEFLTFTVSEVVSYVSEKWSNGEDVFGVEKIDVDEEYQPLFDELLVTLSTTDSENIKDDIGTISNLLTTCIDEGVFVELAKEDPDPIVLATNEEFLSAILTEVYRNERTRPIIGHVSDLVVDIVADSIAAEGDTTPKPGHVDMSTVTEADIRNDAKIFANVIEKFVDFAESTENLDPDDPNAFILNADLASLGASMDMLRGSVLLGDSCEYLLKVMINSDMSDELGFLGNDFVDKLSDKSFKLENALASAQKLAIMAISLNDEGITEENYEEALKYMITEMTPETAETLKGAISSDVLEDFGMSGEEADTMSNTISSVIDGMTNATGNMTDEELEKEMDAITTIVNTMKDASATDGESTDSFFGAEGESITGVTADDLIDTIVSSTIVSDAVVGAGKDENNEKVEDPFGIAGNMSESDKTEAEDAIKNYYENNATGNSTEDEALKGKLDAVANIFGMDSSSWFNA